MGPTPMIGLDALRCITLLSVSADLDLAEIYALLNSAELLLRNTQKGAHAERQSLVLQQLCKLRFSASGDWANQTPNSANNPRMRLISAVRSSLHPLRRQCQASTGLLIDRFDTHKSHVGLPHGREKGLCIIAIVLRPLALTKGLHKLCRHKPHGMPVSSQPPSPVMRRTTGLHTDRARRYRRRH